MPSLSYSRQAQVFFFLVALITTSFLLLLLTQQRPDSGKVASADSEECGSCHSGIKTFTFREEVPAEIPAGSSFNYTVTMVNHKGNDGNPHQLRDNELTLELDGEGVRLADGEELTKSCPDIKSPGEKSVSWQLEAVDEGGAKLRVFINSTAHYNHDSSSNPDDYRYFKSGPSQEIQVKDLPLTLSHYAFAVQEGETGEFFFDIQLKENVTDLVMEIPSELKETLSFNSTHPNWTGTGFSGLGRSENVRVRLNFSGNQPLESVLVLRWVNASQEVESLEIIFTVYAEEQGGDEEDDYKTISKYLGWFSISTLIFVNVLGSKLEPVKKLMKKLFLKHSVKIKVHCWLSYLLLATVLIHGIIHMLDQDTIFLNPAGNRYVFLGDLSTIFMGVVAVNGIFQKQFIRKLGVTKRSFLIWRIIHTGGSLGALVTALLHIYRLQTIL